MRKREEKPGTGGFDATPEDSFDDERFDGSEEVTLAGLLFECAARLEQHIDTNMQRASGVAVSTFEVLIRLLRSPEHQLRLTDLGRQLGKLVVGQRNRIGGGDGGHLAIAFLCTSVNLRACSRSTNFWIFPDGVRGSSETSSSRSGQ